MAKKSSGMKSLKSLFSRSESGAEKEEDKQEKKFKFPKFRMKPKSSSEQQKSPGEKQQMLSAGEASKPAEDGESWTSSVTPDTKRSSLYATTSRAKGKEFSYSELDLRKPKKFATFSFGLRKRKKKDEENLSRSTFGLDGPRIEEKNETPLDLGQMKLDQTNSKRFSMSQPELDSGNTFDIPSPPPVTKNQSELTSSDPNQPDAVKTEQPEPQEPLTNGFDLPDETLKAPIASIPELQLDDLDLQSAASASGVDTQNAPQPPIELDAPDDEAASTGVGQSGGEILQGSDGTTEPSSVPPSHLNPEAPVASADTSFKPSAVSSDAKTDLPAAEPTSADSSSVSREISAPQTDDSPPEPSESVARTSAEEKTVAPDAVYGALYDSLFPDNFTSEVVNSLLKSQPQVASSLSDPPPGTHTEIRRLDAQTEPVRTVYTETSALYSHMSTPGSFASTQSSRFTPYQTNSAYQLQKSPEIQSRYLHSSLDSGSKAPSGDRVPYSELTRLHSQIKSDSSVLRPAAAPPASDSVTSQETGSQVSDSKRRVVLVKESLTDKEGAAPGSSDRTAKALELRVQTTESFSGQMDGQDGPLSPAYLSVGSDEGSAVEIYYSAEEDNLSEDEEMFTVDEREETFVEVEAPPEPEIKRVVFVKMEREEEKGAPGQELGKSESMRQMVDEGKETELPPDSGTKRIVFVKLRSEEDKSETGRREETPEQELREDARMITVEERGGSDVGKETELLPETEMKKVVFVKMKSEEDKSQTEQQKEEAHMQDFRKHEFLADTDAKEKGREETDREKTEMKAVVFDKMQEQTGGQTSEDSVEKSGISVFLVGSDAKTRESKGEKVLTLEEREESLVAGSRKDMDGLPETGMKTVVLVKDEKEGDKSETQKQRTGQKDDARMQDLGKPQFVAHSRETSVVDGGKKKKKAPDSGIARVEFVKMQHEGDKSEKQPQTGGQKLESLVQDVGKSELLAGTEETLVAEGRREIKPPIKAQKFEVSVQESGLSELLAVTAQPAVKGSRQEARKEELPATPVQQVNAEQVCDEAPPPTLGEGPGGSWTERVESEAHPNGEEQLPEQEGRHVTDRDPSSPEEAAHEASGTPRQEEETRPAASGGQRSPSPGRTESSSTVPAQPDPTNRLQSDASQVEHNRKPQSSEWEDSVGGSSRTKPDEAKPQRPQAADQRSLQVSAASLVFTSETLQPEPDQDSEDTMSSGYSSLSTKLFLKSSSPPREDESKQRFRKVSLVSDGDVAEETTEPDSPPEYRWRNRFEGVTQYRLSREEGSPDSGGSALPEARAQLHLSTASSSPSSTELHMTRSDRTESQEAEGGRSSEDREEPAGERGAQRTAAAQRIRSRWETQQLPSSSDDTDGSEASEFTGVFKATLVELVSDPAAPPSTPPATPEDESPVQCDMESLVDTLRSMGPSMRPRTAGIRAPPPTLMSALPPIVEDAHSPISADTPDGKKVDGSPGKALNGLYTLPADLGLRAPRDSRSPLELMKQTQDQQLSGSRGLNLRGSSTNSFALRKPSDSSLEDLQAPVLNGNGLPPSSRLDNSVIFGSYRSSSIDQTLENGKAHRPLFRTGSLPDSGLSSDRISVGPKELGDPAGTRLERFSFMLNSSSSPQSGSLTGVDDGARMSRPPSLGIGSPPHSNSPTRLLSPTGSIDLHRAFGVTDSPLSMTTPILQRSFSSEGSVGVQTSLFSNVHGGSQFQNQEPEPDRNLVSKYRAFPDAYLTKEKEHGKLNPRPGKMFIFDQPGMCGQRMEVRGDVVDATSWELQETISIRVVRGGWVLYEKPNFKGEKIALDEGDIELTYPYSQPEEEQQNGQQGGEPSGEPKEEQTEAKPARRFIIGSIRRAVRDYSVPDISLFPEENAEGKKVVFRDTSEDARIFGFPIKANSIIINAGLWLVYAQPFFQGVPRVLEVGGYINPAAWGVEQPYVGSLHPLKVGEPRVENLSEPKIVIYDKPYFSGKSRTITTNMRDFMTRTDRQQTAFMYSVGSLKVLGGIWVGYEKEGFRGHQYLLEEGEYQDWRIWGGIDAELRSVRLIRADLSDPLLVMFEQPEEEQEENQDENTFEVTEAIPDVELFGYKTSTRSIHVLSGAWIAYSHVDFSGNQYILEKGFYNNCADWGSQDTRICSVQPILLAPSDSSKTRNEIILYADPDFEGQCHVMNQNEEAVSEKVLTKSCRVSGGSWVLYDNKKFSGNMYVVSEGDYPSLSSMGCPAGCTIRSIKAVPTMFCLSSVSLFGLECLEGREITTDTEIVSMVEEGFNNHILSVRVNSGCWVICEHSNYRGRQFLLEPIEITNWPKFSSLQTIGSMYPIRQKRHCFRVKNKERGHYLSVQGGVEEMKSGRVVVTPEVEPMSDVWFYQDGLIKNKLSPTMSLQVVGNVEPGAKVVLWTENRQPIQTWSAQMRGLITSLTFPGVVLDVKGGKSYDKDHVVVLPENDERPSQQWEVELL